MSGSSGKFRILRPTFAETRFATAFDCSPLTRFADVPKSEADRRAPG